MFLQLKKETIDVTILLVRSLMAINISWHSYDYAGGTVGEGGRKAFWRWGGNIFGQGEMAWGLIRAKRGAKLAEQAVAVS